MYHNLVLLKLIEREAFIYSVGVKKLALDIKRRVK